MEEQNKTLRFEIYALGAAEINVVSYSYLKYKNSNIISMQVDDDKSLCQFIKSKAINGIPMMIKNDGDHTVLTFMFEEQSLKVIIKDVTFEDCVTNTKAIDLQPVVTDSPIDSIMLSLKFPDDMLMIDDMINIIQAITDEYGYHDLYTMVDNIPTEYTKMFIKSLLNEAVYLNHNSHYDKVMSECCQEIVSAIRKKYLGLDLMEVVKIYQENPDRDIVKEVVEEKYPNYGLTDEQEEIIKRYEAVRKEMKDAGIITFNNPKDCKSWAINGNKIPKNWSIMNSYELSKNSNKYAVLCVEDDTYMAKQITPDDIAGYSDLSDTFIVAPKDEER